jgi:hypothetical protein
MQAQFEAQMWARKSTNPALFSRHPLSQPNTDDPTNSFEPQTGRLTQAATNGTICPPEPLRDMHGPL